MIGNCHTENKPFVSIMPFAMCTSPANPTVAAATAAAMGVLTPMPCIPVTNSSKLIRTRGGIIDDIKNHIYAHEHVNL